MPKKHKPADPQWGYRLRTRKSKVTPAQRAERDRVLAEYLARRAGR